MKSQVKNFVKKLPYVNQIVAKLQQLRLQVQQLEIYNNQLETANKELEIRKNDLEQQLKLQLQDSVNCKAELERLQLQIQQLEVEKAQMQMWVPVGHYYSPLPSIEEIRSKQEYIWGTVSKQVPGVDLNEEQQLKLLQEFQQYYQELPFKSEKQDNLRYLFENPAYSYSDAIFLYCMIRHLKPKRIIEIGSGYSSCVTLDTNELFFDNAISFSLIEPYPGLVQSLMKEADKDRVEIISKNLQDVALEKFAELQSGDILFIDSTHVAKINSDVNYIFSQILPSLNSGVYIHFHDIFYPFEYPKEWIYEGRAWNEIYMLRNFLQYNTTFKIVIFNTFLEYFYSDKFYQDMPLCMKNPGGSIWLQKL
jgi:predicted O-methyltransferase YrrM